MKIKIKKKDQNNGLEWQNANDVKKDIKEILKVLDFPYIFLRRFFVIAHKVQNQGRMPEFGLSLKFSRALGLEPAYVIEVLVKTFRQTWQ